MNITLRQAIHPEHFQAMGTDELRKHFLVEKVFVPGEISLTYSLFDRIIFGGIVPTKEPLSLQTSPVLATEFFMERRELGLINLGGRGSAIVDGTTYELGPKDGLYIGMGSKEITFKSSSNTDPARYYCVSTTAHHAYPTVHVTFEQARKVHLGDNAQSNKRTINQYVHPAVMPTCQLAMGMTVLQPQNVWNTMPCHTHDRRMEVYFYFDLTDDNVVFHLVGQPDETRHIVLRNEQATISPNWSIHSGTGTSNYTFIWAMAGENQEFTDMDAVLMDQLK
jgi:4-deoxy-L-threo-5-hexosulose-uronate ketol-isomerase